MLLKVSVDMLDVVVGWLKENVGFFGKKEFIPVEEFHPKPKSSPASPEDGFQFQLRELTRLMDRLKGFESVTFLHAKTRTVLTPDNLEKFLRKDKGIDCIIHIVTPTERGAKNVAGRIRNILSSGDY